MTNKPIKTSDFINFSSLNINLNFIELKYKANYYAILLLAFVIPLERKLAPPLIILFLITSLFNHNLKSIITKKENCFKSSILLFTTLFFLYLIGLITSNNSTSNITNVTEKLSLLIFPIAFYISIIDFSDKLNSIFRSFIDGCIVASVICIISALFTYYFTGNTSSFFYGTFSIYLHSSYFAMYLCLCIIIIYLSIYNSNKKSIYPTLTSVFLIFFFSLIIFLLASKTGLITLIILHLIALAFLIQKHKAYLKGILAILSLVFILIIGYSNSNIVQGRINELIDVIYTGDTSGESSSAARTDIWKIAVNLIKEKPIFGYGTGNERKILVESYHQQKLHMFAKQQLNAHNQFLQTSIALGLIGSLTLIAILIGPLIVSFKNQYYLYFAFILLIILNFLTESMLERQSGVVFYAFFNALLYSTFVKKKSI